MKNWKNYLIASLIIIFILVFLACDNNNDKAEEPQFRETIIDIIFNNYTYNNDLNIYEGEKTVSVKIKGTLLYNEWNTNINLIKNVILEHYNSNSPPTGPMAAAEIGRIKNVFNRDIVIIIESTIEYFIYKTIGDGLILYLNKNELDNNFQLYISKIINSLNDYKSENE